MARGSNLKEVAGKVGEMGGEEREPKGEGMSIQKERKHGHRHREPK